MRKVNWHQTVVEVTLILAGILIALSVDSWREEQLVRKAEIVYLEELEQDFLANKKSLNASIEYQKGLVTIGDELLRMIQAGDIHKSPEDFTSRVSKFYFFGIWTPVLGTYDDLINSGRLLHIENRQLRTQLSAFNRFLDDVRRMEALLPETYYQRHAPFLEGIQDTDTITWPDDYRTPRSPFPADTDSFATHRFWSLVVEWMYVHQDVITNYERAIIRCDAILELIATELELKRRI
jgi:hypothetical protein